MALVTLAVAKVHIRATWLTTSPADARDAELQEIVDQASDIIFGYLKKPVTSPPYWDVTTAPPRVRSMVLLLVGHYWEHRGDDMAAAGAADVDEAVWQAIARIGVRDRDPALA